MSASTGALLAFAVQLLADRMPAVAVSGPNELPLPTDATIPPTLIVQQAAGGSPASYGQREAVYTLRCYGATDSDVLTAWDAVAAALTDAETGEPLGPRTVIWLDTRTDPPTTRRLWLYSAAVSEPGGPAPDPEAGWPVIVATATMRWSHKEV